MLGLGYEPPSFTGEPYLGCLLFLAAWITMSLPALLKGDHQRAKRKPWPTFVQELMFDWKAVGWVITVQLAVWLFLKATTAER